MNSHNNDNDMETKEIKEIDVEIENEGGDMTANSNVRVGAAIAAGALAAAGAAAGYYFYASKDAAKHRKDAGKWAGSFKREVMRQMDGVRSMDKESVTAAIDRAVAVYERLRAIDAMELLRAARELKSHWENVTEEYQEAKEATPALRTGKRTSTKAATMTKRSRNTKK